MIASTPLHLPNLVPSTLLQLWVHLCIQLHFIYYCHIPLKPQLDFSGYIERNRLNNISLNLWLSGVTLRRNFILNLLFLFTIQLSKLLSSPICNQFWRQRSD